ncbi:uncharacterized protein LOC142333788 isoform X2 [Lycorma delicatula]|uniref:uncharacterized protein LOC142333788 isoform X2 n=1 Tax=Lycorma delicatula TaxID=130591 RepID=UPI003F511658
MISRKLITFVITYLLCCLEVDSERMKRIHQHYIRDVYSYEKFIRSAFIQYPHTDCLACTTTYLDSELTKTERLLDYIVQNPDSCEKLNGDMFNTAKEIFINYDMYLRKAVLWISTCVLHQPIDSRYFQRAYRQSPTSNFQNVVLVKNGNSKALDECMHRFVKSSALLTNSNYHLRYFYYDNNNLPETRPDILLELVKRRY